MRVMLESVRRPALGVLIAIAALTAAACGEGSVQSATGPSAVASPTLASVSGAETAIVDGDAASTLAKGGNGKGKGNQGSEDEDPAADAPEDGQDAGPGGRGRGVLSGFVTEKGTDTLVVRGITVQVSEDTLIRHGHTILTFEEIEVGDHVQARGPMVGTILTATEVKVEDTGNDNEGGDGDDDDVEIVGAVGGLPTQPNAGCTATPVGLTFTVGTSPAKTVHTNATTVFDDVTCANLANGNLVEVEGTLQADGSILATKVELQSGPNEVQGTITSVAAATTCPTKAFFIGTKKVTTTAATTYSGPGGAAAACTDLAAAKVVEVEGTQQADLSITAAVIEFKN